MDTNRIQFLLSKIYEILNSKQPKSVLEADLLLDYIRVVYADVLELRKEWEHNTADHQILPNPVRDENSNQEILGEEIPNTQDNSVTEVSFEGETLSEDIEEEKPMEDQVEMKNEMEPSQHIQTPDSESLSPKDIYFEEPAPVKYEEYIHTEEIEEELIIEDEQPKKPEVAMPSSMKKNDIRKLIGLNDRYLFMNELFNNNKFDYESALDYINGFNEKNDAVEWLNKQYIQVKKWDKEDATVAAFYEIVSRYFSNFI